MENNANIRSIHEIVLSADIKEGIVEISPPHRWIMELRKIKLSNGKTLLLKIGFNDEWSDASAILNQVAATKMLCNIGMPQPKVISYDSDKSTHGFRYLLTEVHQGEKLGDVFQRSNAEKRIKIFETLGHTYSLIHSHKNSWSGVWDGSPNNKKYPIHPARFYSGAEFHGGSGLLLYKSGKISESHFKAICNIWDENLPYLEQRSASLVHISPFPWSIYMADDTTGYSVVGLTSLGDFMWWDAMSDVAHLLYPPFMDITDEERNGFLNHYNGEVDYKAITLYKLLNRICALSNVYMAPVSPSTQNEWIANELVMLITIIDEINAS